MPAINSASSSRFRDTALYVSQDTGTYFYGPYIPPVEFDQEFPNATITHLVASHEVGFMDKIAVKYYGEGNEALWWSICRLNGIVDVESGMWTGQILVVPTKSVAQYFTSGRSGKSGA